MNFKAIIETWRLRTALVFAVGSISSQVGFSSEAFMLQEYPSTSAVEKDGIWNTTVRSLQSHMSVTLSVDHHLLVIRNIIIGSDIEICIMNESGEILIEQELLDVQTTSVEVMLDGLSDGAYTYEVRDSNGNYNYGNFIKKP